MSSSNIKAVLYEAPSAPKMHMLSNDKSPAYWELSQTLSILDQQALLVSLRVLANSGATTY